jgi:hypothetical protein
MNSERTQITPLTEELAESNARIDRLCRRLEEIMVKLEERQAYFPANPNEKQNKKPSMSLVNSKPASRGRSTVTKAS